ncbi:unnamed protein product [Diamesa tonsa]
MVLKLLRVLLIFSVVIASGSSCGNNGNVTAQDPKYFKFNKGFFFIHGLTNGESVVMYKTPDLKLIYVQYTFINDYCFYETRSYNIIENGTFADHVKFLEKKEEFSNRKTLSFNLDGKAVEIKFEINTNGFTLLEGIKGTVIETFEVKLPINNPGHGAKDVVSNDVSSFEFVNKDSIKLHGLTNGESVVMYKTPDLKLIYVQYTFINDDCFYETRSYNIIENGTFVDHVKVLERKEEFFNRKKLSFNVDDKAVEIKFEVNTTGFTLLEGIKGTVIDTFEVKLPINNPGHGAKDVVSNDVSSFEFVNKDSIKLTDMKNGRLFYQNYKDPSLISGSYVFKTSSDDYYTMDYAINNPLQDNPSINIEGYEVKDVFSFYKQIQIEVKYEGAIKEFFYFFESTGLSIAENYALWLSVGAQKPTHEGSMAN